MQFSTKPPPITASKFTLDSNTVLRKADHCKPQKGSVYCRSIELDYIKCILYSLHIHFAHP